MHHLRADLVHAWRALRRRPTFALVTIATLATGLGATIAMFAVTDAVLLRPLPFPNDHQLVSIVETQTALNMSGASMPAVRDWSQFPEIAALGAHEASSLLFNFDGGGERVSGVSVAPGFFHALGVAPALGTVLSSSAPWLDPDRKIVLSHALWRRQFHSDPAAIGRTLVLEQQPYTVIGVMPPAFTYPSGAEFWTSLPVSMSRIADERELRFLEVVARLAPGADVDAVRARLRTWKQMDTAADPSGAKWTPHVMSLREEATGQVRAPLLIVMGGVWLLLIVACANAAALVLANSRAKMRDLALQSALGAHRSRLISQILIEGLLLSAAAGLLAMAIAGVTRDAIVALGAGQIPGVDQMHVDVRVFAFAIAAVLFATIGIALGPALAVTRSISSSDALASGSRTTTGGAGRRLFGPLVALEFALALVLASSAGLLAASYRELARVDAGFRTDGVMTAKVEIPNGSAWPDRRRRALHDALLSEVSRLPGVESAGVVARLPLSDVRGGTDAWPEGRSDTIVKALLQVTSEGYFTAVGARMVDGRDFSATDTDTAPAVAVINDVLARQFWPGESALGRQISFQFMRGPQTVTVAGVVHAMKYGGLAGGERPEIYLTFRQTLNTPLTLAVKASTESSALIAGLRDALAAAEPSRTVTFSDVASFDTRVSRLLAQPRFYFVMALVFGSVSLILAALGTYGTMMFWIGERWREFGIRVALGATAADVARTIVVRGVAFALVGITCGLVLAVIGRAIVGQLLFHVSSSDPTILMGAALALLLAAVAAAVLPARRVSRVDPVATLRGDA